MAINSNKNNKTNNNLSSKPYYLNTEKTTCDVWNPGPGFGQVQKCGVAKPINGILTLPSW